jgi:hypothetical protein
MRHVSFPLAVDEGLDFNVFRNEAACYFLRPEWEWEGGWGERELYYWYVRSDEREDSVQVWIKGQGEIVNRFWRSPSTSLHEVREGEKDGREKTL